MRCTYCSFVITVYVRRLRYVPYCIQSETFRVRKESPTENFGTFSFDVILVRATKAAAQTSIASDLTVMFTLMKNFVFFQIRYFYDICFLHYDLLVLLQHVVQTTRIICIDCQLCMAKFAAGSISHGRCIESRTGTPRIITSTCVYCT